MTAAADCNASEWLVSHTLSPMKNPRPVMQPFVKVLWPLVHHQPGYNWFTRHCLHWERLPWTRYWMGYFNIKFIYVNYMLKYIISHRDSLHSSVCSYHVFRFSSSSEWQQLLSTGQCYLKFSIDVTLMWTCTKRHQILGVDVTLCTQNFIQFGLCLWLLLVSLFQDMMLSLINIKLIDYLVQNYSNTVRC